MLREMLKVAITHRVKLVLLSHVTKSPGSIVPFCLSDPAASPLCDRGCLCSSWAPPSCQPCRAGTVSCQCLDFIDSICKSRKKTGRGRLSADNAVALVPDANHVLLETFRAHVVTLKIISWSEQRSSLFSVDKYFS